MNYCCHWTIWQLYIAIYRIPWIFSSLPLLNTYFILKYKWWKLLDFIPPNYVTQIKKNYIANNCNCKMNMFLIHNIYIIQSIFFSIMRFRKLYFMYKNDKNFWTSPCKPCKVLCKTLHNNQSTERIDRRRHRFGGD